MEMDEEEKQLVADAGAQDGAAAPDVAPDAAPPVPQDDEDDDMLVRLLPSLQYFAWEGFCVWGGSHAAPRWATA